ncbi:MAG: hypothetical protein AAGC60_11175 [Acidobacteriota bacterium]
MRRRFARGEGKAGCIFWMLLLMVAAFGAYKFVPIQIQKAQLKDYINELVLHNGYRQDDWLKGQIKGRAADLRLPVKPQDIKISRRNKGVFVEVQFTTVVDLIFTDYVWNHTLEVDREIFSV